MNGAPKKIGQVAAKFGWDIVPVTFGVLLALLINQCQEDRKQARFLKETFTAICQECEANRREIDTVLHYQNALMDSLEEYIGDTTVSVVDVIMRVNGFKIAYAPGMTGEALRNTDLTAADRDLVYLVALIGQTRSKWLDTQTDRLGNYIYANFDDKTEKKKQLLYYMMSDLVNHEENLVDLYKQYDERYEKVYGPAPPVKDSD